MPSNNFMLMLFLFYRIANLGDIFTGVIRFIGAYMINVNSSTPML